MVSGGNVQTLELRLLTLSKVVQGLDKPLHCLPEPAVVCTPKLLFYFQLGLT